MILPVTVCLAVLAATTAARKDPCEAEQFEYFNQHLGCHDCDKCPPGTQPSLNNQDIKFDKENGALTCYTCSPCPSGTYKEKWNHNKCTRCLSCDDLSRQEVRSCRKDKNTDCGKCQRGYHDKYRAQKGVEDTRTLCQPCFMALEVPDCAAFSTSPPSTKATILAETLLPTQSYKEHVQQPMVPDKEVKPPQTGESVNSAYPIIFVAIAIGICFLAVFVGFLVYKNFHPRPPQNRTESRYPDDSIYRATTVNIDYTNLSSEASSSGSLSKQKPCAPSLGSRFLQAVSPPLCSRKVMHFDKPPSLDEDVTEDSADCNLLHTEIRNQKVCREDFNIIQRSIGLQWKYLARELDIKDAQIDELEMDNKMSREKIYQMLLLFEKNSVNPPILETLCEALEVIQRRDIVSALIASHSSS